jgi:GntR family transcriptional regulator, rspAB operon transcriptional repressor
MATAQIDRRTRLSDQAYAAVRAKIVTGELMPGARLAEAEIATSLGISRTPLREALLRLADEGLLAVYPQSGSFIAPISLEAMAEAQFVREHLECAVIRETAERIDADGVAALRRIVAEQQAAHDAREPDRFYELDEALHAAFAELAGRAGVWRVIQQGKVHLDRVRVLSLPVADHIPHLIRQHRAIIDALAAHDPAAAETALRRHLREVFATVEQLGLAAAEEIRAPRRRRTV